MLLLAALGLARAALFRNIPAGERLLAADWWVPLLLLATLGVSYCYVASSVTVTSTTVVLDNPLRRIAIPLGHVRAVEEGSNLCVVTDYIKAYAWGVEAANVDLVRGRLSKQASLAEVMLDRGAARQAVDASLPPARYRWRMPAAPVVVLTPIYLLSAVGLAEGWRPFG
jgi:hypothetical protein